MPSEPEVSSGAGWTDRMVRDAGRVKFHRPHHDRRLISSVFQGMVTAVSNSIRVGP